MNILDKITNIAENTGIVIVELLAHPVLDDVAEHMMHDLKKIFIKDFKESNSILEELETFSHDLTANIKKDFHLLKSVCCFHPKHGAVMKDFVERSLVKNGFETAATAALVAVVESEVLPILISGVVAEQIVEKIEEKYEPKIKENILRIREKMFSHKNKRDLK